MLEKIITDAINNREYISFTYSNLHRVAQPAAIGVSRADNVVLRCYQTEGKHVTPGHEWDLCEVSKISNLSTTGEIFTSNPPGYKKGDKHMKKIYTEL